MLSSEIVMNLLPKIRDCLGYSHNNSFLISSNRSSLFQSLCRVIRQPDYTIRELLTKDRGPDSARPCATQAVIKLAVYGLGGGSVIGAGPGRGATLPGTTGAIRFTIPPGASFFGVRSSSLFLSDFGTLLFVSFFIFYSLFLVLFLRCFNQLSSWIIRIRAKVARKLKNCSYLGLISKGLCRDSLPKISGKWERQSERRSSDCD
jgi:hypothetical protein